MPSIILASASPQRSKLLKQLGIPFTVKPSHADEIKKITTTASALVIANARLKARSVASEVNEGIVLGADTIVYVGNKRMIGKPKSLKEAKANLKILFSRPQWVYTGVAIIDVKTGRELVGYEKTKVHMLHLTDDEIDRYHQKVSPFDKAGGFDIEGWGAAFINRIEGCYTNVIGLPMAKVAQMLKKFGVTVLSLMLLIGAGGCTSEYNLATKKQERYIYDTDKEVAIGDSASQSIEKKFKVMTEKDINERVEGIMDRLVAVSDRQDIVYFIRVLDDDLINAVSLPGGYIYLFRGLLDKMKSDDEVAGVIAHELGHITAKHGIKRLQSAYGAMIAQIAAVQVDGNLAAGVGYVMATLFTEYSQENEFEADRLGVKYMKKAGFDPKGMIQTLEILRKEQERAPLKELNYWKTHPDLPKRKAVVNQEITGSLAFPDYLQLIGE